LSKPIIHIFAIIIVLLLIYSNTLDAPFQFDDIPNIVDNPAIQDFHYSPDPSMQERINKTKRLNVSLLKTRYIGYLSFALNYSINGLDVRGYHIVNILIHLLNSLLMYWFMTLTFTTPFFSSGDKPLIPDDARNFIAFFASLLFAVHPMQTQAVTYIVQRFASLATLFYLLSLVMYIKSRKRKEDGAAGRATSTMFYGVALFSSVLAMKTKEFAFTLPLMITLYEVSFFEGKIIKRLPHLLPFFLSVILIPFSLSGVEGPISGVSGIKEGAVNLSGEHSSISKADYLFTQFRVIVTYIRLLFFPVGQNIDHDYPVFNSFFDPSVFFSFLFLLSIVILGMYLYFFSKRPGREERFRLRLISFGIFWFFVTSSAESGIVPIIDVIFEHRVYLPSIGFFIAFMAAIGAVKEYLGNIYSYAGKLIIYLMFAIAASLSVATYERNTAWQDALHLWGDAVKGSPNKARPHHNFGLALAKQGKTEEAIKEFLIALRLKPDNVETHYELGVAYNYQGRIDDAIKEFQAAVILLPDFAEAHNNLGLAYIDKGRIDDAINEFQILMQIRPEAYPMAPKFIDFLLKKKFAGTN
jgi:hypothetical protein